MLKEVLPPMAEDLTAKEAQLQASQRDAAETARKLEDRELEVSRLKASVGGSSPGIGSSWSATGGKAAVGGMAGELRRLEVENAKLQATLTHLFPLHPKSLAMSLAWVVPTAPLSSQDETFPEAKPKPSPNPDPLLAG